ncbi:MAG TPA: ABC transporter ATP-binding protein, partial [Chloroflexia bacterium]|nr:ABC transporter ATP-binding protein [Chloroflexia bacterium]
MIKARGLVKRFGEFAAVAGLDLDVAEGEILALLGHNGAGKTTTVRMLCSLLAPSGGTAQIAGYDVVQQAEQVRSVIGLLTELPGLYNRMRAREYLDFFGAVQGLAPAARRERAESLLHHFDLTYARDRRLGEYSKGMRQKVALIRTLLHDPLVVFLDEPTSAMDPQSAKVVRDAITDLRGSRRTIVLCSHNLAEAEGLADHIVIIKRGRVLARGTADELKRTLLGPPLYELRLAESLAPYLGRLALGPAADFTLLEQGADWLRYRTGTPAAINPAVLGALTAAGARVLTLSEVPRSLETVYLTLMADAEQ